MAAVYCWEAIPSGNTGKAWAAIYQVATLVKHKSWKAMMDSGGDPREGLFPSLGLIVSWFLAVTKKHNSIHKHNC